MKTWIALLLTFAPMLGSAAAPVMPEPAELEPDIRFWMRVYSEISTNEGYIHDQWNLAIVYQTLHFDPELPPRQREQQVSAARDHYQAILRRLGSGAAPQDDDEQRVRGLWAGADATRLALAAEDVRFQLGQSDRFRAGLRRAGTWEQHIAQTLAAAGLPPQIAALPHVESSFQPMAQSKAGAAGLWQFIRSTGRRYLRIDRAVDERLDPYRSTEAAAQLLAYNYRVLGTWPLAITAYNHGAAGMRRAREQVGSDDIVRIVRQYRSPSFGFASRNYYSSFLAALRLDREPEKYFGALQRDGSEATQELPLPAPLRADALARTLHLDGDTLRALNPALRSAVWNQQLPVPRGYRLRLPASLHDAAGTLLAARLPSEAATPPPAITVAAARARPPRGAGAAAAGSAVASVAVASVAAAVPGGPRTRGGSTAAQIAAAAASFDASVIVHGGDTLAMIALQTGVDPEALMRINGLRDGDHIYEGQRLTLLAGGAHAAADALRVAQAVEEERQDEAQAAIAAVRTEPVVSAAQAQAQGPTLLADAGAPPSADPIDYSVDRAGRVIVVAAETIGHYADWLGVSAASLRQLNGMHGRSAVLIGRHFRLAFTKVTREQFEQRRRDYHQQLQTEYFAAHRIIGSDLYVARRGDSLWSVTQRGGLPVWLLQQYNPDVDFAELRPGTQIVLPRVEDVS
jgi:membrane-bound lytic murein transglycosylase D